MLELKNWTEKFMSKLENWSEVTRGLYQYVILAKGFYELHILYWDHGTNILTAKASLYSVSELTKCNGNGYFERRPILLEQPVFECLEAAVKDYKEKNG